MAVLGVDRFNDVDIRDCVRGFGSNLVSCFVNFADSLESRLTRICAGIV